MINDPPVDVNRVIHGYTKFYVHPDREGLGLVILRCDESPAEIQMTQREALAVAKAISACSNELRERDD